MKSLNVTLKNEMTVQVFKLKNDVNGNPRYLLPLNAVNVKDEDYNEITFMKKYRGKQMKGYVIQSFNIESDLQFYIDKVKSYYNEKAIPYIKMSEYHAYGRRCGWDFIVMKDGQRVEKTFHGTNKTNEFEALHDYYRWMKLDGKKGIEKLKVKKVYA